MTSKTARNISDSDINGLKVSAGSAGDCLQAAICDIALGTSFDADDWGGAGLDRADIKRLESMTREEAISICVDVINEKR